MAKVVLGKRPESFKHTVKFKMLDGSNGAIEVKYKYRTRKEAGELQDEIRSKAKSGTESIGEERQWSDVVALADEVSADSLMKIVIGWDLDEPLTRASIESLCNELPGAAEAMQADYWAAVLGGRLGN